MKDNSRKMLDELSADIRSGKLQAGSALPSESLLGARYRISRPTVRRVLDKLVERKLVEKRPGIESFVRAWEQAENAYMYDTFNVGLLVNSAAQLFPHYSALIVEGIGTSPYGKSAYLKPLVGDIDCGALRETGINGLLITRRSAIPGDLRNCPCPAVVCNAPAPLPGIGSVRVDHRLESRRGMAYLLRCGYRNIAVIGGSSREPESTTGQRYLGCLDAFREADCPVPEHLHLEGSSSTVPSREEMTQFIREKVFDAAFFVNGAHFIRFIPYYDLLSGRKVRDLPSVVFDNVEPLPELADIPCAYIRMPLRKFGECAIEFLRRKAHDPDHPALDKVFDCDMVVRY